MHPAPVFVVNEIHRVTNVFRSRLLVRHPDVLKRLRDEVRSISGEDAAISKAQVQKMTYLRCVIDEST